MEYTSSSYVPQQKVIDTYAPLPFEALATAAAVKRKGVETNEEYEGKLADLMDAVNAMPGTHQQYRENLLAKYEGKLNDISNEIYDKGDPNYGLKIKKLVRDFMNDKTRLKLESSYTNYLEMVKDYKYKASNDKLAEFYFDRYTKFYGGDPDKTDINEFIFYGAKNYNDPAPDADAVFEDIKANASEGKNEYLLSNGTKISLASGLEGITDDDIRAIADANIDTFAQTKGGKYLVDYLMNKGYTGTKLTDAMSDFLYDRGMKNIYSKTKSERGVDVWDKDRYGDEVDIQNGITPDTKTTKGYTDEGVENETADLLTKYYKYAGDLKYDDNGNIVSSDPGFVNAFMATMKSMTGDISGLEGLASETSGNAETMKSFVKFVKAKYPTLSKMTEKGVIQGYTSLVESQLGSTKQLYVIPDLAAKSIKSGQLGSVSKDGLIAKGTAFTSASVVTDENTGKQKSMYDYMNDNGLTPADIIASSTLSGGNATGEKAGNIHYEITDKDGEVTNRFSVKLEEGIQTKFNSSKIIGEAKKEILSAFVSGSELYTNPNTETGAASSAGIGQVSKIDPTTKTMYLISTKNNPIKDGKLDLSIKMIGSDGKLIPNEVRGGYEFTEQEVANHNWNTLSRFYKGAVTNKIIPDKDLKKEE